MERYRYDAYGEVTVLDADHSSDADGASDVENPYLYTGRRLDAESGLMQYRHRYYSVGLGRFVSRDPEGYVDGYCLYEYGIGSPVNFGDPLGEGVFDSLREWGRDIKRGAQVVARRTARGAKRVGRAVGRAAHKAYDKTVQAGVNKALTGKSDPTDAELGAGYLGAGEYLGGLDNQAEMGFAPTGHYEGLVNVTCCDENNCKHHAVLHKKCKGLAAGITVSGHSLGGINGRGCPGDYAGYFWEIGVGLPVFGFSYEKGEKVSGGGFQGGIGSPLTVIRCHYAIAEDVIKGSCH